MYFYTCVVARMAELVDARDLKSLDWKRLCEFKSRSGHHHFEFLLLIFFADIFMTRQFLSLFLFLPFS